MLQPPEAGLILFVIATSISPGPNNLLLAASGLQFGFVRTLPILLGIEVGFTLLILVAAAGLAPIVLSVPGAPLALRVLGAAYLVWLAYMLWRASEPKGDTPPAAPVSFWAALTLQAVNPKGWMMAVGALAAFTEPGPGYWATALVVTLTFGIVGVGCMSVWALFGAGLRRLLSDPKTLKLVNRSLAALTAASAALMFI
jgi:threonine/homoserine/homoserine lactone efflux protein